MSALRILHLGKYYTPDRGGIETVVETLCHGERPTADTQALVLNKVNETTDETLNEVPVRRVGEHRDCRLGVGCADAAAVALARGR